MIHTSLPIILYIVLLIPFLTCPRCSSRQPSYIIISFTYNNILSYILQFLCIPHFVVPPISTVFPLPVIDLLFLRFLHPSFFYNIYPLFLLTYLSSLQLQTNSLNNSFHNVTYLLFINSLPLPITIYILHFRYLHTYLFPLLFIFHITPPESLIFLWILIVCDRFCFNDPPPLYFTWFSYYIFFKSPVLAAAPDMPPSKIF